MASDIPFPEQRTGSQDRRSRADRLAARATDLLQDVLELVLPQPCASCGGGRRAVCRTCRLLFTGFTDRPREVSSAASQLPDGLPVWAAGAYRHEVARLVLAYKNGLRTDAAPLLGRALGRALQRCAESLRTDPAVPRGEQILLVPVPSSSRAYRRRGFSPAEDLLRRSQPRRTFPDRDVLVAPVLVRKREMPRGGRGGQKGLGRGARARRARHSMVVAPTPAQRLRGLVPELEGRTCVVVDDVLTTGATLREAVRALRAAGAVVPAAVVLAAVRAPDAAATSGFVRSCPGTPT